MMYIHIILAFKLMNFLVQIILTMTQNLKTQKKNMLKVIL